ncbi:hypothetical protein E3N88_27500 [Mikania micrantha]|uniref:Uncharacterized protein n=1 Tax=Mikania micrantha TaxID=192012 RepID=A0A5N6MWU8_9ASTR|nr:hypothetical protein E3N88_27500 [Mikania micrantha]
MNGSDSYHVTFENSGTTEKEENNPGVDGDTASRMRGLSRWDPPPVDGNADQNGVKNRKSLADDEPKPAFQLPDSMKDFTGAKDIDPKIQAHNAMLMGIGRILQSGPHLDERPEGVRMSTPEAEANNKTGEVVDLVVSSVVHGIRRYDVN